MALVIKSALATCAFSVTFSAPAIIAADFGATSAARQHGLSRYTEPKTEGCFMPMRIAP